MVPVPRAVILEASSHGPKTTVIQARERVVELLGRQYIRSAATCAFMHVCTHPTSSSKSVGFGSCTISPIISECSPEKVRARVRHQ